MRISKKFWGGLNPPSKPTPPHGSAPRGPWGINSAYIGGSLAVVLSLVTLILWGVTLAAEPWSHRDSHHLTTSTVHHIVGCRCKDIKHTTPHQIKQLAKLIFHLRQSMEMKSKNNGCLNLCPAMLQNANSPKKSPVPANHLQLWKCNQ